MRPPNPGVGDPTSSGNCGIRGSLHVELASTGAESNFLFNCLCSSREFASSNLWLQLDARQIHQICTCRPPKMVTDLEQWSTMYSP